MALSQRTRGPQTARTWCATVATVALLGTVATASAQNTLSRYTSNTFVADGDIGEFINDAGDSQEYFVTFNGANPDFGKIKDTASLAQGVFVGLDVSPTPPDPFAAGPSGFRDRPGSDSSLSVPTGFNIGRLFVSYNDELDAYFVAFDITAPAILDVISFTQPVAFDVDGDGDVTAVSEFSTACPVLTEIPTQGDDVYRVSLDLDQDGFMDVRLNVVETFAFGLPAGAVALVPSSIPGSVFRYVQIEALGVPIFDEDAFANLHLDSDGDGVADMGVVGVGADVELMISNVSKGSETNDPFGAENTAPCCVNFSAFVDTDDDECLGGGAEDTLALNVTFPCPDIEVTKQARCVTPASTLGDSLDAYVGADVQFEVTAQNYGNTELTVTMEDLLSCTDPATATLVPNSCMVTSAPAGANPNFCDDLAAMFAEDVNTVLAVGMLDAADPLGCATGPGDAFTFVFSVAIGTNGASTALCDEDVDCVNNNSVEGIAPLVNPIPNDQEEPPGVDDEFFPEVVDLAGVVDTTREEMGTGDDGTVDIEVACRGLSFIKEVGPLGGPFNDTSDATPYDIPSGPYPLTIVYRWIATNDGEEPEDITITDDSFCTAVMGGGVTDVSLGNCALCANGGSLTETDVVPGASLTTACEVIFASTTGLTNFLALDDGDGTCSADNLDPRCYRNCASASSEPSDGNICGAPGPLTATDDAVACNIGCVVETDSTVQCLDNCTNNPGTVGAPTDALEVADGACVQYRTETTNLTPDGREICRFRVTDSFSNGGIINIDPASVMIMLGATSCTVPADFNTMGNPYEIDAVTDCGISGLPSGEKLTVKYNATIDGNAGSTTHTVNVEGTTECSSPMVPFTCEDPDDATTTIVPASLTCLDKQWEYIQDTDCDGTPDGNYADNGAPTSMLDLTTAIFPVRLRLTIAAENDGLVPLNVTVTDPGLSTCVLTTPGVGFVNPGCELGNSKPLVSGASDTWTCELLVESAAAMRNLDDCNPPTDGVYTNQAELTGAAFAGGTGICVPDNMLVTGDNTACTATIQLPPACAFEYDKAVKCENDLVFMPTVDALPGTVQTFRVRVFNTGTARPLTQLCIDDTFSCNVNTWFQAGTVSAEIDGDDVSADFAAFRPDSVRRCYTFASRVGGPAYIAPGEVLTLTFDVRVPDDFGTVGQDPDCVNEVQIEGYEDCPSPATNDPATGTECTGTPINEEPGDPTPDADINVITPSVDCSKQVSADFGSNGVINRGPFNNLIIQSDTPFPLALTYTIEAENTGEIELDNVMICDPELINDANAAAGVSIGACDLDAAGCFAVASLAVNATTTASCTIRIADEAAFLDWEGRDGLTDIPPAYANVAEVTTEIPNIPGVCGPGVPPTTTCSARVQLEEPPQPGWNAVDADIRLTPDQPAYWSAITGEPGTQGGLSFTILDPPFGRPVGDGSGDTMLRGFIIAYAVDAGGQEIRWNHLFGEAMLVDYRAGTASQYNSYAFAARPNVANGEPTKREKEAVDPGIINLDGDEFDAAFDKLIFNFFAADTDALSSSTTVVDTVSELTLMPISTDLREVDGQGIPPTPVATLADFDIYNANEAKRTGTDRCVTCWDSTLLRDYGIDSGFNWFLVNFLGTDNGKAVVDGVASGACDTDFDPDNNDIKCFCGWCPQGIDDIPANNDPRDICATDEALLGVIAKHLDFGGMARDVTCDAIRGRGTDEAVIQVDLLPSNPSEETPMIGARPGTLETAGGSRDDVDREPFNLLGNPVNRASLTTKGSVLIIPKVDLRWDAAGRIVQDTIITMTNDYNFAPNVRVQMYFVNGDPPVTPAP